MARIPTSIIKRDKEGNPIPLEKRSLPRRKKKPLSQLADSNPRKKVAKELAEKRAKKQKHARQVKESVERKQTRKKAETRSLSPDAMIATLPEDDSLSTPGTLASAFKNDEHAEILECVRIEMRSNPDMRLPKILELYEALTPVTRSRRNVFDKLCMEVGLAPDKFLGYVAAASLRFNRGVSMRHLSRLEPDVVQAMARRATGEDDSKDGGTADAANFLKASGLIREGKGATTNVAVQVNQGRERRRGLPEFNEGDAGVRVVQRVREEREKLLTPAPVEDNVVEGEFEDVITSNLR